MAAKVSRQVCFSWNVYEIIPLQKIEYHIEDGRKVEVFFHKIDENTTEIFERFEPEMLMLWKYKTRLAKHSQSI
jgi:phenylpropionate dioxygenase-like ring-hydroxylating dioxygenase large terminal subunit